LAFGGTFNLRATNITSTREASDPADSDQGRICAAAAAAAGVRDALRLLRKQQV